MTETDNKNGITFILKIDPDTARRYVTGWLITQVSNVLIGGTAQLVITNQTLWRVPVLLISSQAGTVGQVGTVDVDAVTGKLLVNDELIGQILHNVKHLVTPTYS
ncbi:MAG: hypothetical protein ACPGWR_22525 [Ardenticatenaceae bacterium]